MTNFIAIDKTEYDQILASLQEFKEILSKKETIPAPIQKGGVELACDVLGRSKSWIYKATMQNSIPFKRFNSTLVFDRQELTEWMEEHTTTPTLDGDIMSERLTISAKKKLLKV